VRFEVLMAVRMTMFFWVVTPSGLVGVTAQSNNIVRY
jgi:hypothetical protein